jgi:16S rRNA (guanine527-N7)-methyltransferase
VTVPGTLRGVLEDAQRIGLIGPQPVEMHVSHAESWAAELDPAPLVDLGSGAGLPGLVFAHCWTAVEVSLLDSQTRRTAWLRTAVARLGLEGRVRVLEGRAEDLGHDPSLRERFPLVVARGFGPAATTAECGSAFTEVGGRLSVSDPPGGGRDERWPSDGLRSLGLAVESRVVQSATTFVILRKHAPLAAEVPRLRNLPLRKPLW